MRDCSHPSSEKNVGCAVRTMIVVTVYLGAHGTPYQKHSAPYVRWLEERIIEHLQEVL